MKIDKYVKRIEAVHFDGATDVQEIAEWCGGLVLELVGNDGRLRKDMYVIDVPSSGGYMSAGAGFYIFRDGESFFALPEHDFKANFEKDSAKT